MTVTRVAKVVVCSFVLFFTYSTRLTAQPTVSTVHLTSGWATFGQAVPQGIAHSGLHVGNLPTQTDVKSRWPDGSIRFAVVTVQAPATGSYAITAGRASSGTFELRPPAASVTLTVSRVAYTATLVPTAGDAWLSGPLVQERRTTIAPVSAADGRAHSFLRVNFDTRVYSDGQARVDVSVENMLDGAGTSTATYDAAIVINGSEVFRRNAVRHSHLTRWRQAFDIGSAPRATVTPDIGTFITARALPSYASSIRNVVNTPTGPRFDILREGALAPNLRNQRGEDAAPLPHWTARYLVHRNAQQRGFVLANGDLSGSWPVHLRAPDTNQAALIGPERLAALNGRTATLVPDSARQPSIAFVPYLLTGDRYYAEEMAFWAQYALSNNTDGDTAWALRNIADAAAFAPDASPLKAYFSENVANILASLDAREAPAGAAPVSPEQNTLAYAIDRANRLGFAGGAATRDQVAKSQLESSTHDRIYPNLHAAAAARLSLMIAVENGWEGAQTAFEAIAVESLSNHEGWALAASPASDAVAAPAVQPAVHAGHAASTGGLAVGTAALTALPHNIPDFGNDPSRTTIRSVQSGRWASPTTWSLGRVPGANEVVHVDPGHVVTIDTTTAVGYTVQVHGTLRFSPTVNTRLVVTNLMVMGDHGMPSMTTVGYLEVGTAAAPIASNVTAEIIIANTPIGDSVSDPEQFGTGLLNFGKLTMHGARMTPTWTRVAVEPRAGNTTLTLSEPASGWEAGDRIVIPDTRHLQFNETNGWVNIQNQWEELTVQSISPDGRTVTLTTALQFNHLGARDQNGVLEFLPHVGNLTRNVIVRSQSATGTRGHFIAVHIADTDVRYALFDDLGRTKFTPLNTTTNAIGRYPIHMHHNRGPQPTPANGFQFTLIGNAVDGGSAATQFKWGIAVHNSHYGLIQDNVVYNYNGASIATEDGSESFNVFDHNFALRGMGEPDNSVSLARTALGTEGVGFWFRGPNNYVINNVAANFQNPTTEAAYGFVYQFRQTGSVPMPNFKGADPAVAGQFTSRNANNMPLLQFENNEAYGAMQGALTFWWVGSLDPQPYADARESIIKDFRAWHTYNKTVYVYPSAKVTLDGLIIRNAHSANAHCCGNGVHFNDYSQTAIVIRNSDIQGANSGIDAPASGFGPAPNLLVENSFFRNWSNIGVPTPSSVNGCWMDNKLIVVRNSVFQAPPGRTLDAIGMEGAVSGAIECLSKLDEVRVFAYQGNANDNFQIYHSNSGVQPRPPGSCSPGSKPGIGGITCPIAPAGTPAPTVTLSASPSSIASGGSATLTWSSTNATSVSINQGIGAVAASGSRSVSPTVTTTYTITATNSSGSVTDTVTVTVGAPPTASLSASPTSISSGQSSTLTWSTSGATSVSIAPGIGTVAASGTRSVSPASTTTYTLTATNSFGSVTSTATVTVTAPAPSPHTAARANSYDDTWQTGATGWAENAKTILANGTGQVPGMVLWIGDSLTRSTAMGAWAQSGAGKTAEDQAITNWMHAGLSPQSIDSVDGFALATPYFCSNRSYTVGDGLGSWHFMDNAGMPDDTNPTTARQKLANCTAYPNDLSLVTILSAIQKPQFAIPEVNLDAASPGSFPDFERMVDLLISKGVVPIIITYTYRGDTAFNQMVDQYNTALVNYARTKKLPLIDFNQEMLLRLPFSQWPGRFLADGVHYTTGNAQFPATSSPYSDGGDPATHATGLALTYNGYGLKGWLGVQKMKEIKQLVIDTGTPPTVALSASPSAITAGGSSTLTWTSTNATSVTIDQGIGAVPANGSRAVSPAGTTTYTITASNAAGSATATATVTVNAGTGSSRTISIDFVGNTGAAMGAGETAGVVPLDNWNTASGADSSAAVALFDDAGINTGATVTWSSDNVWSTTIADTPGNARMMKGYLDTGLENATTVTVAGLPAGPYDVYVYIDGDNGAASRTGSYQISGAGITTTTTTATDAANANFAAAFTQANNSAGNFVRFSITAGAFTLTATPGATSDGRLRAPINGIQIVSRSAPPPPPPPPPADFTIAATPATQTTTAGGAATYSVNVGAVNGFTGTVALSVTGVPANATASFAPSSIAGSGTSTLTVTSGATTPAGTSTLTITGTSGTLTHSATVQFTVRAGRVISVNFTNDASDAMGAAESAGVIAKPNWNNASGADSAAALALKDETGALSGATMTWSSDNVWETPIVDQAGDRRMMKGYLDNGFSGATTIGVAGFTQGSYDVYVYVDGDNGAGSRTGVYRITAGGVITTINLTDAANTNFNAAFVQANNSAGNYVRFTITGTGFTLTATPGSTSDGRLRAPVNGIQLVPR